MAAEERRLSHQLYWVIWCPWPENQYGVGPPPILNFRYHHVGTGMSALVIRSGPSWSVVRGLLPVDGLFLTRNSRLAAHRPHTAHLMPILAWRHREGVAEHAIERRLAFDAAGERDVDHRAIRMPLEQAARAFEPLRRQPTRERCAGRLEHGMQLPHRNADRARGVRGGEVGARKIARDELAHGLELAGAQRIPRRLVALRGETARDQHELQQRLDRDLGRRAGKVRRLLDESAEIGGEQSRGADLHGQWKAPELRRARGER